LIRQILYTLRAFRSPRCEKHIIIDSINYDKINIDSGCVYGGALAALRLDDGKIFYVKSKEKSRYELSSKVSRVPNSFYEAERQSLRRVLAQHRKELDKMVTSKDLLSMPITDNTINTIEDNTIEDFEKAAVTTEDFEKAATTTEDFEKDANMDEIFWDSFIMSLTS